MPSLISLLLLLAAPAKAKDLQRVAVVDDVVDPMTMDPFLELSEKNHTLLQQMLEGLVKFDPDGDVIANLAEKWEQVNENRLRFHLRRNVSFHDGESLDAENVKFSLERFCNPSGQYPGRGFFSSIDRVEIVDPLTVDIITKFPDGVLLRRLAGLVTIVPKDYYLRVGSDGFSTHPIGTGPFEFASWTKGRSIVLKAFPGYWKKGYPKIDELTFAFIPAEKQVSALLSGDVSIVTELPGTATLEVRQNPRTTVVKKASFFTVAATMNVSKFPLSDARFRRAMNYSINRNELIRYDLLGNGIPLAAMSMPGQVGHDPSLEPYPFDPARAKRLLREMGLRTPIHLQVLANTQGTRTAKIIAKQLEDVGIILDLETGPESEMFQRFKEKDWDIGISGMPDPTAHSSFIQSILLYSKSPYSICKSTDFDHRLEDVMSTIDPRAQEAKARELDRYIYNNALSLFTYQRIKTYGIARDVRFSPSTTGMSYFDDLEVLSAPGTVQ